MGKSARPTGVLVDALPLVLIPILRDKAEEWVARKGWGDKLLVG